MSMPRYVHDCTECQFLGQVGKYDIYTCCRSSWNVLTGIARFNDSGRGYVSCSFLQEDVDEMLKTCAGITITQAQILVIFSKARSLILGMVT